MDRRSLRRSRAPSRGRLQVAHSRKPASPSVQQRNYDAPPRSYTPAARSETGAAAERDLRTLGHRVHRRTRSGNADRPGVATLTARELEVAQLVVDRGTNSQIADALFLSPKTVETHMRNIFRKLDVSSRVEVARTVERAATTAR